MLERTTRSYFEDILSKDFTYLEKQDLISLENKRSLRCKLRNSNLRKTDDVGRSSDERNMTRKTRTRRPRIPAIQSGYCAVCNIPYNNVEDHIQSKKHLKLIGEDANYIALNGSLNGFLQTNSIPFLNLNGIDAIGVHETSLEDFSPKYKRRSMPRTRAASVVSDRVTKPSPLSPTGSDVTGHHLRSRRNINYMTPPLDEDSLQEKLDLTEKRVVEPVHQEYREYRELRSSTRALAKLTEQLSDHHEEVWNSGRPKRACIRQKRVSVDDRLVSDNKTYYKVEVLSSKLRSNTNHSREPDVIKTRQSQLSKREEEEKEKGLIVKFKKLRNSELIQLNNEATNFLFPKKDDESSEEEGEVADEDCASATASVTLRTDSSDTEDGIKMSQNFKVEDEASMDSTCSENKRKKKRRTHAEAFIMDNQKYYKFETPGSSSCRLRYHGSYLPSIMKSPKHGEACSVKKERDDATEEAKEKVGRVNRGTKLSLEKYKFSFEKIPHNAAWYNTFQRIDKGEQRYSLFNSHYYWDPFTLPYQMPSITPLDPKVCVNQYSQLLKFICDSPSETESIGCSTPECSITTSNTSVYEPEIDEDSKMSAVSVSSTCSTEEPVERKRRGRRPRSLIQASASGKNPRKSPRQHASTLAILSSLIQQRKRRSRNKALEDSNQSLPSIPEEDINTLLTPQIQRQQLKLKTPLRKLKPKIDYFSVARQIDEELDTAWEDHNLEELELEVEENPIDFSKSKVDVNDVLRLYEEEKSKENEKSCRRFFNGTPGRKPGRRKKKNKTGWPNKNKRLAKKGQEKEKEEDNDDSTIDSMSVNMDSDEDACEEDTNLTDSVKKVALSNGDQALSSAGKDQSSDVDRVEKVDISDKVLTNKVTNRTDFQPYVCVEKLDSDKLLGKQMGTPKRTNRRQRRMPGSPKSPRMLRKPRGRWYRER